MFCIIFAEEFLEYADNGSDILDDTIIVPITYTSRLIRSKRYIGKYVRPNCACMFRRRCSDKCPK
ncbi:hypothetical protein CVS40_3236 [Lucilia cuprina]|nr:hypothetical protein CVS40_3236 [Lucilia cuprina]